MPKAKRQRGHPRGTGEAEIEMGQRIKLRRIEQRISQMELGEMLGVTFQQVQKYEKGANRVAGSRITEIARALKTTPNYLHGWDETTDYSELSEETWRIAVELKGLDPVDMPVALAVVRTMKEARRGRK